MPLFENFPYTNFHEMNLDWILQELKKLTEEWDQFADQYQGITASAQTVPYGSGASVTVTGGGDVPFNFDFDIPAGKDLKVNSTIVKYGISSDTNTPPVTWYDSVPVIPQADYLWTRVTLSFTDGSMSTFYSVARNGMDGTGSVVTVNNVSPDGSGNVSLTIPDPSNNTPVMDSQYGDAGIDGDFSRSDHSHPSDTTKLDKQSGNSASDLNAYVVEGVSTQSIMGVSSTPVADTIVAYDANGCITVNEPQNNFQVPRLLDVADNFLSLTDATNYVQFTDKATASTLGIVQPDGVTISVDSDGIITSTSGMVKDTLWTNASPSSAFADQSLPIDTTDYQAIVVVYRTTYQASGRVCALMTDSGLTYPIISVSGNQIIQRNTEFSASSVTFDVGKHYTTYGSGATDSNNYMIPLYIYGLK